MSQYTNSVEESDEGVRLVYTSIYYIHIYEENYKNNMFIQRKEIKKKLLNFLHRDCISSRGIMKCEYETKP